ncbi:LysR family transcriptional regulator [Paenibacillus albidus]|uniref:LysR family transcriptional regulator n=1 Tax=Paenibacillus albidus TaxID=2041023 RepID=UPI001BE8B2B9|nr:LysR family transcriptional regulator [Paenibacillus albidus]MBT2292632.1 LysR family transcriptional regulator [Paenibacillus albidus]
MDLKTLKTFQTIVSAGSFNKAADELKYAQSTVTMQIQKLEADLGVQLIERGKQITLTEAGRLFHEQSRYIVCDMERLYSSMEDIRSGDGGRIRIGVTDPTASYRFPQLLQEFLTRYPKMDVSVEIAGTAALSKQLLHGELDLALCSAPELGEQLYFEPLFTETFVLLLPGQHPLAYKEEITAEDLRGHRLLITAVNCPYRKKLESVLQESGGPPLDTRVIGSMTALKYYVAAGLGIALVPGIVLNPPPHGTVQRTLQGKTIDMVCGILCRISDYPLKVASARLAQFLQEQDYGTIGKQFKSMRV